MSQAPHAVRNARWGTTLGVDLKVRHQHMLLSDKLSQICVCMCSWVVQMEDTLWSSLTDAYVKLPMALTAEKLGDMYGITREDCDEFAFTSQQRWQEGACVCVCVCLCVCVVMVAMLHQQQLVQYNYMGLVDLALLVIFKFLNDEQGFLQDFFLGRGGGGGEFRKEGHTFDHTHFC